MAAAMAEAAPTIILQSLDLGQPLAGEDGEPESEEAETYDPQCKAARDFVFMLSDWHKVVNVLAPFVSQADFYALQAKGFASGLREKFDQQKEIRSRYHDIPESASWFQPVKRARLEIIGGIQSHFEDSVLRYICKRGLHTMLKIVFGFWYGHELPKVHYEEMVLLESILGGLWLQNMADPMTVQLLSVPVIPPAHPWVWLHQRRPSVKVPGEDGGGCRGGVS